MSTYQLPTRPPTRPDVWQRYASALFTLSREQTERASRPGMTDRERRVRRRLAVSAQRHAAAAYAIARSGRAPAVAPDLPDALGGR